MTITYFTNIAFSSPEDIILTDQDFQTFLKVLEGGKNGACLKKIKGQKRAYSAYLNDGARLLFVEDDSALRLIAKFCSHDEYMAKLKQKGLASRYLKELTKNEFDLIFSNIPYPEYTLSPEEHTALLNKIEPSQKLPQGLYCTLEGKQVVLNEKQKSLGYCYTSEQEKSYTRLLTGGPGTGKTVSLMSEFEEAYGRANRIAAELETKHSSEEVQQFIYLTTTPQLADKVAVHFDTVIPNKILPCLSHSYQNFAAMVDLTIPPLHLSSADIEEAIASGQKKYKRLKTKSDFTAWCKQQKIKPEDYLENSAGDNTAFYEKLYQEFRILSAYPNLTAYQALGVLESLFLSDKVLKKSLYELYERYAKDFIDLNFYDLSLAIKNYKKQFPNLVSNLFLDEAQNLSRIQFLNLKAYAADPEKMVISLDPRQSVYDPISNFKFIKRCFEEHNVRILPIELDHSYRVPLAVSTLLQQVDNLEKEYAGGCTESKHQAEIYTTYTDKPGELVVIYESSPKKAELLEECKNLCKRPNCLVIVGDISLLAEAQAALTESEEDTLMFYTSDKSIGLEFDHVILYKPWAGFTEAEIQSLMFSLEKISISQGNVNKPKDKHDKTKHSPLPKLHQLLVAASRALETLRIIPGVDLKPVLPANQAKTRAQKKQNKEKISPIAGLTEYLLKTSTIISQPSAPDKKATFSSEQIHQEWVETCWKLIVHEKEYDEAQRICEQKHIKVEELNLLEGLKAEIPPKYHTAFFRTPIQQTKVQTKTESMVETNATSGDIQAKSDLINKVRYVDDLLKTSNFQANKILTLLEKEESTLEDYLMITLASNGKNLWENIFQDPVKTQIFLTVANTNSQYREKVIALAARLPDIASPTASCHYAIISALETFEDLALAKELLALGNIGEKELPEILYDLGHRHENGFRGAKGKDVKKAIAFYERASNKGHAESDFKLGSIYERFASRGLKDASEKAKSFYIKAIKQGHEVAKDAYSVLLKKQVSRRTPMLSKIQPAATESNEKFINAFKSCNLSEQKNPLQNSFQGNANNLKTTNLLIEAIKKNNQEAVFGLLNLKKDPCAKKAVDEVDAEHGGGVLFWAAYYGHAHFITPLIRAGADANQVSNYGITPVHIAAQNGHSEVISALKAAGANVNTADNEGVTPVYMAAQCGHTTAIAALKSAGANVNMSSFGGTTPVHIAAQLGHVETIRVLKEVGAVMDTPSKNGFTPVHIAAYYGRGAAINALKAAGALMDTPRSLDGATPVFIAAQNGYSEVIRALKAAGANVNMSNKDGITPVYIAAQNGHSEVICVLKAVGASMNTPDSRGRTPVFIAAENGHSEAIRALKSAGAAMNTPNGSGITPVFIAAENGHAAAIVALKAAGVVMDTPILSGETPVFIAAQNGHSEVIRVLKAAGASVNAPNNQGTTPIFMAAQLGHAETIGVLKAAGAAMDTPMPDGFTPVHIAAQNGHVTAIAALKAAGAAMNIAMPDGRTPVFIAAAKGHAETIFALKAAGAAMNIAMPDGRTPVFIAAYNGHAEAIRALKAADANVATPKDGGYTPTFAAAVKGHAAAITALLEARADASIKTNHGTALELARKGQELGHKEVVRLLEAHFKNYPNGIKAEKVMNQETALSAKPSSSLEQKPRLY